MNENGIVYLKETDQTPGIGLLMCKYEPFNMGKPIRFLTNNQLEAFVKKYNLLGNTAMIPGYNIIIVWIGTKEKTFESIPLGHSVKPETLIDLNKMAEYYEKNHIKGNESRLKKFKRS